MNSSQRSNLDFSGTRLEELSSDSVLEVMQEKTDEESASKYVLIKHDFYSSDSDHGRELLADFISALCDASYKSIIVYLIGKGTRLLDESNPLHDEMLRLTERSEMVIAASESVAFYEVNVPDNNKITEQSSRSIAEDIIFIPDLLILE